jgi:hypothetical protein
MTMTNEQRTANKRKPAGPGSLPSGARKKKMPEERLDFEERVVHGEEPDRPAGQVEDPDRLTKSGRLNLEQVKDAVAESDKDD